MEKEHITKGGGSNPPPRTLKSGNIIPPSQKTIFKYRRNKMAMNVDEINEFQIYLQMYDKGLISKKHYWK